LVQVKNKRERPVTVWPLRSGKNSRLGSRDLVADGIMPVAVVKSPPEELTDANPPANFPHCLPSNPVIP
jgi:hypothetical protein